MKPSVAIIGSGPAALMCASVVTRAGFQVAVFEKRKSIARKLLIAGSSGLNITNAMNHSEFISQYSGPEAHWDRILKQFSPQDWIHFIESLGISTFQGSSGRFFVEDMKAAKLLQAWIQKLEETGVKFVTDSEVSDFSETSIKLRSGEMKIFDALCFGLGGGSYESNENPLRWPEIFLRKSIGFTPFCASNVGYEVAWPDGFLKEAEGRPLKNIVLTTSRGERAGELMITRYGLEGTPIYSLGIAGTAFLDLKPDLTPLQIEERLSSSKENLSPMRRAKKQLGLDDTKLALLFHYGVDSEIVALIKKFPIQLLRPRPIDEAISSSGGVHLSELDNDFKLKKFPGVFLAGEMLDWDAPTGGFLIQGAVSQGYAAGIGMVEYLVG